MKYNFTFEQLKKLYIASLLMIGVLIFGQANGPALEMTAGSGNTVANGPTTVAQTIFFQNNTDNTGAGTTFTTYAPTLSATYAISNIRSGNVINFGQTTTGAVTIFELMNAQGAPADANFTSAGAAVGTGIVGSVNRAVRLYVQTLPLRTANRPTNSTTDIADLTITFNRPVNNPVIHLGGLGGTSSTTPVLGFSALLDLTSFVGTNVSLTRLSGNGTTSFQATSTSIFNGSTTFTSTGATSGSGSVRVNGTGITSLTFKIAIKGDGVNTAVTAWSPNNDAAVGEAFSVSFSTLESDIQLTKTMSNTSAAVGSNVNFVVTATNNGASNNANINITDVLPTGYSMVGSPTASVGTYTGGVWNIPTLNAGASATLTMTGTVLATGNYTNTATLTSSAVPDSKSFNNTATVSRLPDSDRDGVFDNVDLDDDNDGIPDTLEKGVCGVTGSIMSMTGYKANVYDGVPGVDAWAEMNASTTFPTASFNQIATFDYNEFAATQNAFNINFDALGNLSSTNPKIFNYQGITISPTIHEYAITFTKIINADEAGTYQYTLTNADNHVFVYRNGVKVASRQNVYSSVIPVANFVTVTVALGDRIDVVLVEEDLNNTYITMSATKTAGQCLKDTDGDGTPDHLDLDSDNDGCSDVIEGDANFAVGASYITGNRLNTPVNASGVPGVPAGTTGYTQAAGQAVGTSANSGIQDVQCLTSFVCDSNMYLGQSDAATNTTLYGINTTTNPLTYPAIGTVTDIKYNAMGFHPNGFIYALSNLNNNLIRINANGTYNNLGTIANIPSNTSFNAGEIDNAGNFYVSAAGTTNTLYRINISTMVATPIALTPSIAVSDYAYNVNTGLLYGVNNTSGLLTTINPTTGAVATIGTASAGTPFGAMMGSNTGAIYGVSNNGGFYQFNITNGTRILISNSPTSSGNDGAHCVTAPITFTTDLSVTKTNNTGTYTPGTNTVYTIVVRNNGPFGVLNATVGDNVPAGIPAANVSYTAVASSGSTTGVIGTQTGAINDLVSLPINGTVTYTVTVSIPATFTGNLINTVIVTPPINITDSNTTNNTASDTDTPLCFGPDADGDGIPDMCDYDDDNDGILDIAEDCAPYLAQNTSGAWTGQTASTVAVTTNAGLVTSVVTYNDGQNRYFINQSGAGQQVERVGEINYQITFSPAIPASEIAFYLNDLDVVSSSPAFVDFTFSVNGGTANSAFYSTNYVTAFPRMSYDTANGKITSSGNVDNQVIMLNGMGNTLISSIQLTSSGVGAGERIQYSFFAKKICDTDGDGIPNRLDLDSDGDGCTDAIEGGANFTTANLVAATGTIASQTPNQNLGNTVGNTPTTIGVPTIAGTGQSVGQSQDGSKNDCVDTDADGIPDWEDLDDDNDGILDTVECPTTLNDFITAYSGGTTTNIVPSDFQLAPNVKNQNVTRDLSAKFGYPANSGAVIVSITNASVHPTQNVWWTKNGEQPSRWKITGTMSAYVLMGNDFLYYANDSKTIHIYDNADVIPVTVPGFANQTAVAGQWGVSETQSQKTISNLDTNSGTTENANWRYVNMNIGPKSFGFSTTVAFADPNYAVIVLLECDTDKDGIPDRLDLDSDNDGCFDALEGDENVQLSQLNANGSINTTTTGGLGNVSTNLGVPNLVNSGGAADIGGDVGQGVGDSQNALINLCYCYKKPVLDAGSNVPVQHGITALTRAGGGTTEWPTVRQSAWTILEANTKGFVVNKVAFEDADNNTATPTTPVGIPTLNYVEGMMVYDTIANCLKIYNGTFWNCYSTQTCPPEITN